MFNQETDVLGWFYLTQASSAKQAIQILQDRLGILLPGMEPGEHWFIEFAPYGPDHFPMDYLEKGYDVVAAVFSATDPRKGCVGMILAIKVEEKKESRP